MTDYRAYARETALRAGCDPDIFERQIQQESGFNPAAFNVGSGATGIAQIIPAFHPNVDPNDPIASLDYAATWLVSLRRQFGSYAKALAAYNWGPGNVGGFTREDGRVVPPWDGRRESLPSETQQYLDVILGSPWVEPDGRGSPAAVTGATYRTTDSGVRLREGPGTAQAILVADLGRGTILQAVDDSAPMVDSHRWLHVRTLNGMVGYVAAEFVALEQAPTAGGGAYRLTEGGVRLRQAPGSGQPILIADLGRGTIVVALDETLVESDGHQWRHVRTREGTEGYVAADFLARHEPGGRTSRFTFNADTPAELQLQSWTCSIRSTMWLLKSIGIAITPEDAQNGMSPQFVTEALGLLDASGAGIVQYLQEAHRVEAVNQGEISFDEAVALAGQQPLALGGRNWGGPSLGHWTAVRGVNAASLLVLANPGGTGPQFGQQTLDRGQFSSMGPFSAVWIPD
jgi:hypothetical protein